jgi:hypothetical protein
VLIIGEITLIVVEEITLKGNMRGERKMLREWVMRRGRWH